MATLDHLPNDIDTLKAIIIASEERNARKDVRIERLEKLLSDFKRALYGAKSEKGHPDQYHLALEDIETAMAAVHAEDEAIDPPKTKSTKRKPRGLLPKYLPRVEEIIEPDSTTCSCGHERHVISEEVSERLDIVPAQFRVIVTRRPRYACRKCEGSFVQTPALPRLIENGMPTEATVATVLVSKYADHLPLFRQSQIYARQGVNIERATLASWVGKAAHELRPIHDAVLAHPKTSSKLFMDETPAPVLDPGRGKVKKGYFWALARDDRGWNREAPPGVAFTYTPGRSGKYASEILQGFCGILQVDGYAGYNRVLDPRDNARSSWPIAGPMPVASSMTCPTTTWPPLERKGSSRSRRFTGSRSRSVGSQPTTAWPFGAKIRAQSCCLQSLAGSRPHPSLGPHRRSPQIHR